MHWEEAVSLEQRAHQADRERAIQIEEKKRQRGLIPEAEMAALSKKERERRIWAFMYVSSPSSHLSD